MTVTPSFDTMLQFPLSLRTAVRAPGVSSLRVALAEAGVRAALAHLSKNIISVSGTPLALEMALRWTCFELAL